MRTSGHSWCETDCSYPRLWEMLRIKTQYQELPNVRGLKQLCCGDSLEEALGISLWPFNT